MSTKVIRQKCEEEDIQNEDIEGKPERLPYTVEWGRWCARINAPDGRIWIFTEFEVVKRLGMPMVEFDKDDPVTIAKQASAIELMNPGARLADGQSPLRFCRAYENYCKQRAASDSTVSFAEYAQNLHPGMLEPVPEKKAKPSKPSKARRRKKRPDYDCPSEEDLITLLKAFGNRNKVLQHLRKKAEYRGLPTYKLYKWYAPIMEKIKRKLLTI